MFNSSDKNKAGKICPNCYQSEDSLLVFPQTESIAKEYAQFIPLFEVDGLPDGGFYNKFIKANSWILEKYGLKFAHLNFSSKDYFGFLRKVFERLLSGRFGGYIEAKVQNFQKSRILSDRRTVQKGARVLVSDKMLYFHP